jgi:hypothetical protein
MASFLTEEDVLVCSFKDRAAVAVLQNDPEAALQLLREFDAVATKLFLTIIPPPPHVTRAARAAKPQSPTGKPTFVGRPMVAKFPGRCAVCSSPFDAGSPILFNGDLKRAAHDACGGAA